MSPESKCFFIVADSLTPDGGLYCMEQNGIKSLRQVAFTPLSDANYLCFSPDRKTLYSTCDCSNPAGGVAAFRLAQNDSLTFLNKLPASGRSTCHLTCSGDGRFLFAANYSSGSVSVFSLNPDGSLDRLIQVIVHQGITGPNKARQEAPHTHCTVLTPDGHFLCVADLGLDAVFLYPLDPKEGLCRTPKTCSFSPGDGPRHIVFDAAGNYAYVVNELGNSVTSLSYSNGSLTPIMTQSTLPHHCTAATKASAIRFSPDGRFLFASNRGYDSVACFQLLGNGTFRRYDMEPVYGSSPRDIQFLPSGDLFAAANEFSDSVTLFQYDTVSGKLAFTGSQIRLPRPLCILF